MNLENPARQKRRVTILASTSPKLQPSPVWKFDWENYHPWWRYSKILGSGSPGLNKKARFEEEIPAWEKERGPREPEDEIVTKWWSIKKLCLIIKEIFSVVRQLFCFLWCPYGIGLRLQSQFVLQLVVDLVNFRWARVEIDFEGRFAEMHERGIWPN